MMTDDPAAMEALLNAYGPTVEKVIVRMAGDDIAGAAGELLLAFNRHPDPDDLLGELMGLFLSYAVVAVRSTAKISEHEALRTLTIAEVVDLTTKSLRENIVAKRAAAEA